MKIGFISRWLLDEYERSRGAGGGEQQRVEAYSHQGHQVIVLSQAKLNYGLEEHSIDGIKVVASPRWKRAPFLWPLDKLAKIFTGHRKLFSDAFYLHKFLKKYGPFDVLEAQCEEPDGIVIAFLSLFQKLPRWYVQIFALRYSFLNGEPQFSHRTLLGFVFKRCTQIKANSFLVRDCLRNHYGCPASKIMVVTHNLTHDFLSQPVQESRPPQPFRVLCLSALNEKKGVRYFVEAAHLIAEGTSDIQFVSIGGSTSKNNYKMELFALSSKYNFSDRFSWKGEVRGHALQKEISTAHLIVIPSLFDEWNRAAVEAVALGKPVVVTNQCGVAPWIERFKCGIVVPSGNANALATAIKEVLDNDSYYENAQKAALEFRRAFSPQSIAEENINVFNHISGKHELV
jgi:glycosyltransferase involved in cell wall biosynthesis